MWEDLKDECKVAIGQMLNTVDYKPMELPFSILNKLKLAELKKLDNLKNLDPIYIEGFGGVSKVRMAV